MKKLMHIVQLSLMAIVLSSGSVQAGVRQNFWEGFKFGTKATFSTKSHYSAKKVGELISRDVLMISGGLLGAFTLYLGSEAIVSGQPPFVLLGVLSNFVGIASLYYAFNSQFADIIEEKIETDIPENNFHQEFMNITAGISANKPENSPHQEVIEKDTEAVSTPENSFHQEVAEKETEVVVSTSENSPHQEQE